jgi:hypothetical protein
MAHPRCPLSSSQWALVFESSGRCHLTGVRVTTDDPVRMSVIFRRERLCVSAYDDTCRLVHRSYHDISCAATAQSITQLQQISDVTNSREVDKKHTLNNHCAQASSCSSVRVLVGKSSRTPLDKSSAQQSPGISATPAWVGRTNLCTKIKRKSLHMSFRTMISAG